MFPSAEGAAIRILPLPLVTVAEETPGLASCQLIQTAPSTMLVRLSVTRPQDEPAVWNALRTRLVDYLAAQGAGPVIIEKKVRRGGRNCIRAAGSSGRCTPKWFTDKKHRSEVGPRVGGIGDAVPSVRYGEPSPPDAHSRLGYHLAAELRCGDPPRLAANYHVIAVGMDGHDPPNERREFSTSAAAATSAAEFVRREFDGHLDALYAASLGCTVAMSMVIREKVHVDHLVLDGAARPSFGVLTLPIAKLTATMVHGAARGRYALLLRLFGLTPPQMRDHFLYKGASKTTLTNGCREGLTFFDMLPPATHYPDIAVACWYGSREKRLVDKGIAKLREYFPELEERAFPRVRPRRDPAASRTVHRGARGLSLQQASPPDAAMSFGASDLDRRRRAARRGDAHERSRLIGQLVDVAVGALGQHDGRTGLRVEVHRVAACRELRSVCQHLDPPPLHQIGDENLVHVVGGAERRPPVVHEHGRDGRAAASGGVGVNRIGLSRAVGGADTFGARPAVVASGGDQVDFLEGGRAHIGDQQLTGRGGERQPERITQAVGIDVGGECAHSQRRVVRRCGAVGVEPQDLAVRHVSVGGLPPP